MTTDGDRDPAEPPQEATPLPAPPGGPGAPRLDSGMVRLLESEDAPVVVHSLPTGDDIRASVRRPEADAPPLDDQALPRAPTASDIPVAAETRPGGGGGADFDPEDTSEWSLERAREEVAGHGEDSHVIGQRYRILEGLAMGGMGAVFKVKHMRLGKEFALKIIHSSLSEDANMQRFFFREARILSQLDHPNIVHVTDFGSDDRFGAYLVMEYLKGESLHARLDRVKRLGVAQAIPVALQVAEALHSMHQRDLVHCDIKPENIFLVRAESGRRKRIQVKLIDFGLSRNMAQGEDRDSSEVGGTPIFAAPEQIQGLPPRVSMDIYAVGELLYHMLTGQPPFVGSIPQVCAAKLSEPPQSPSELTDQPLDAVLEKLILKALATRPDGRHATMAQLVFELRTVSNMLGLESGRTTTQKVRRYSAPLPSSTADLWSDCTVPVFVVDASANILHASKAFEQLAAPAEGSVVGQSLGGTKLGNIYPGVDADVMNAAAQKTPLRRLVRFQSATGSDSTLLIWIVPRMNRDGEIAHFWGVVVPG